MNKYVSFEETDDSRYAAGFHTAERAYTELGVSKSTWFRWKKQNRAPAWTLRYFQLMSGDLSCHGWNNWYINKGVLYQDGLNPRYHYWHPEDVFMTIYCRCGESKGLRSMRNAGRLELVT